MKQEGQQTILSRFCSKILLIPIIFLLANCATTSQIIDSGVIRIGMSKNELRDVLYQTYPSEDPFIPSGISEMFYKEKKEIIYGSANTVFYVFRNVTKPIKCGIILCDYGNGYLEKWFYTYLNAKNYVTSKELPKVEIKKKAVKKDKDLINELNKLIEDYKNGKITEEEFSAKKATLLK